MSKRVRLNVLYAAIQAFYWMACCPIYGFGAAFLLDLGFSSVEIGMMLGISNILAVLLQPPLSALSDADKRFSPIRIAVLLNAAVLVSALLQMVLLPRGPLMAVLWTFMATCSFTAVVFMTAVKFQIDGEGVVDFGVCRAAGSLAWGVLAAGLGFAMERFGIRLVPFSVVAASAGVLVLLAVCGRNAGRVGAQAHSPRETSGRASTWPEFIRANPWLMVLLVGTALVYLHHSMANNFGAVLVNNVGGDNSDLGLISALSAVLEIPGMVLYSRLEKRFGARSILAFSLLTFTMKSIALWLAASVGQLTLAFSIQVLCYGLFMTSTVSFADQIVRPCDLVKAQSCFTLVTVVSSILSSFVGGALFQALGATPTLGVAAVTAAVGLAISLISIVRIKLVREEAAR